MPSIFLRFLDFHKPQKSQEFSPAFPQDNPNFSTALIPLSGRLRQLCGKPRELGATPDTM
jgi:hypothetical protein